MCLHDRCYSAAHAYLHQVQELVDVVGVPSPGLGRAARSWRVHGEGTTLRLGPAAVKAQEIVDKGGSGGGGA